MQYFCLRIVNILPVGNPSASSHLEIVTLPAILIVLPKAFWSRQRLRALYQELDRQSN